MLQPVITLLLEFALISIAFSLLIILQFRISLLLESSIIKTPLLKSCISQFLTILLDPCIFMPCLLLLTPIMLQSEIVFSEDLISIAIPLFTIFIIQLVIMHPILSGNVVMAYSPVLIICRLLISIKELIRVKATFPEQFIIVFVGSSPI